MSHVRTLFFDALEARKLLTKAHSAVAHTAAAVVAAPLVLDGTLTLNNHAATQNMNADSTSTTTTSVPIAGRLGSLGEVHGFWNETTDSYGDYIGPDTLSLHDSQGAFIIAFNNGTPGPAYKTAKHTVYYQHAQHAIEATGAYAGDTESGTIDLNMNRAHTQVESVTLETTSS